LIKSQYECKGYNARQFITEFPDKGWTKNSINRLLVALRNWESLEQSTVVRAAACRRRSYWWKRRHSWVAMRSQEDKPQSHRTVREISREAGRSIGRQFRGLFTKNDPRLKSCKKRCAQQLTEAHSMHAYMQFERW